jgi:hypothetical protein
MIPRFVSPPGTKYPWRTEVKFLPSSEHNVSIESFFRTARHQIGAVLDKSGIVDPVRKVSCEHHAGMALAIEKLRPALNPVPCILPHHESGLIV